ncbi:MAG: DivIVA domain-containing protein [Marmoricola sp.]
MGEVMPPEDEVKPLTPEDVSNKRFTPVRLREGYDMGEVDQFLDQVEAELERLITESNDLRAKLEAAQGGAVTPATPAGTAADGESATTGSAAAAAPRETIKVVTPAEASSAALRLLELATRNADEVVAEAKEEAEQIVVAARTEAETVEQEARSRAQNLDSETDIKRSELLSDLEKERTRLDSEVDTLRAFEREYRSRLKSYFTEQLAALDGVSESAAPPEHGDEGGHKRLRSILGGEGTDADGEPNGHAETDGPSDESESEGTPRG